MASKDKSLKDALKEIFKRNKSGTSSFGNRSEIVHISEEVLRDLNKESPLNTRVRVLKELCVKVTEGKLENTIVEKLWKGVDDLFGPQYPTEVRHLAFYFLQCLLRGQSNISEIMRAIFFHFITNHNLPEDTGQRFDLLNILTSNGRTLLHFEEKVGRFLLNWIPEISQAGKIEEYLSMLDNLVRYNAAYLDDEVISGFIQHICVLCCGLNTKTVKSCLEIMSSIVAYSNMPPESLPKFIGALCRTVVIEEYCTMSWTVMKKLLGTHMGHSSIFTMCRILQEPDLRSDTELLRGAVFYTHMALWSSSPLTNLHCPPSSVLPSFLQAVKCNQAAVAFEVVAGLKQLIQRHGTELQDPAWSILLQILFHIITNIDLSSSLDVNKLVAASIHDTLNLIEHLMKTDCFYGSVKQFYDIIEECSSVRPDSSILGLINYQARSIVPIEHLWLTNLNNMLAKYFKPDVRSSVRLRVLEILNHVIKLNRRLYEDELIDRIVVPHMGSIVQCTDVTVRSSVASLLIDLCLDCESKKCLDLLDILEKMLLRPFESHPPDTIPRPELEHSDLKCLVEGLIKVFIIKIHKLPSMHAVKIHKMLVTFLELHYKQQKILESVPIVRKMILECLLKLRADARYHLGYLSGNKIRFSPYLCVVYKTTDRGNLGSPVPQSPAPVQRLPVTVTQLSLKRAFNVFTTCLSMEKDWEVLHLVLVELTKGLQNKSLILSKHGNSDLDVLVDVLCSMVVDKTYNLPDSLNITIPRSDFYAIVLLVIVNLASYHSYLDQIHQQKMIRCIIKCPNSLGPRSAKHSISALTICGVEMKEAMVKMLPEVLLSLSKISATIHIAVPVLEFLSTLSQLPTLYANFVAEQYMSIFAIALPYTNPFKYDHYTVSLAHHVIAVWFLKCRLTFRKDFVRFITKGLQTNLLPFEEGVFHQNLSDLNQDSSDRKRSSSLTEQGSRKRSATMSSVRDKSMGQKPGEKTTTFYQELTETCIDLMARYAYSPCSALPRRLPVADFLMTGGQSMCWFIGNKLITITTSGCSKRILKNGLCDKCLAICSCQNEGRKTKSSRSGSNETEDLDWISRQNSNEKSNTNTSVSSPTEDGKKLSDKLEIVSNKLQQIAVNVKQDKESCNCWCTGWAEIYIRRPTGDMSWVMRIQNNINFTEEIFEFPLNELSTLFRPSLDPEETGANERPPLKRQYSEDNQEEDKATGSNASLTGSPKNSPSRQDSKDSVEGESDYIYDDGTRSRNPVRRSNSSPEMSASWKNPFCHQKIASEDSKKNAEDDGGKKNKGYQKDMRVSCEAIPEEIAGSGTTPPSGDSLPVAGKPDPASAVFSTSHHPSLMSCHSYPGSSPPKESGISAKPYQTVPPTPNIQTSSQQPEFIRRPTNLPNLTNLVPLSAKPPQSPTQTSPRFSRHAHSTGASRDKGDSAGWEIQKSSSASIIERNVSGNLNWARERAKERKNSGSVERLSTLDANQAQMRDRVHTISVSSPATRISRSDSAPAPPSKGNNKQPKEPPKSGVNPSFVFLQLFHANIFNTKIEKPVLVKMTDPIQRAMKILDHIHPFETHSIGVIYVKEGQVDSEVEIFKNRFGSLRYIEFLQQIGTLVKLTDLDPQKFYLGGLDHHGNDGKFAYLWQDDIIRVMFHVATMMPNQKNDPNCNDKKRHIGNNFVTIVYNESGEEFNISTIKGQLTFASIVIQPLDLGLNRVVTKVKDDVAHLITSCEPKLVSDQNVGVLARQMALHANMASLVIKSLRNPASDPYASNWLERLRKIKSIRNKVIMDQKNEASISSIYPKDDGKKNLMEDFTDYT
ncbi:unnamed protein product [Phyllotreta striolata]|uniref:Rap-GAP domain-containing protein n=1 Tax=Phyllotreta striolata TaxID=444603 RepID=A0A9N9TVJ5_PHYSR|nr:unnamed protein product [Phyllotreta striolata]